MILEDPFLVDFLSGGKSEFWNILKTRTDLIPSVYMNNNPNLYAGTYFI